MDQDPSVNSTLFGYLKQLYSVLNITKPSYKSPSELASFEIAHLVGFKLKEEYELLRFKRESDRQKLLLGHIRKILPIVIQAEKLKEKAKLNGHFKNILPPQY